MKKIFHTFNEKRPYPGTKILIRYKGKVVDEFEHPEVSLVMVEAWTDGIVHYIEVNDRYTEIFPEEVKDWCYLSDLMKLR